MTTDLTFADVVETNRVRCARWHGPDSEPWSGADWSNATGGEVGEMAEVLDALIDAELAHRLGNAVTIHQGLAANTVKKLRRHETGTAPQEQPGLAELHGALGNEIADFIHYAILLADHYNIDVAAAVADKFNAVSEREGFPERLPSKPSIDWPELVRSHIKAINGEAPLSTEGEAPPSPAETLSTLARALDLHDGLLLPGETLDRVVNDLASD